MRSRQVSSSIVEEAGEEKTERKAGESGLSCACLDRKLFAVFQWILGASLAESTNRSIVSAFLSAKSLGK